MPNPAYIIQLHHIVSSESKQIGKLGTTWAELYSRKLPLPPTFIINAQTINEIKDYNHLEEKIQEILRLVDWQSLNSITSASNQIRNTITRQKIPHHISQNLLKAYHSVIHNKPVQIKISHTPNSVVMDIPKSQHVQGDANLIQSLLHMWAELYQPYNLQYYGKNILEQGIGSYAFLVHQDLPKSTKITSYSKDPRTNDKTKSLITIDQKEITYDLINHTFSQKNIEIEKTIANNDLINTIASLTQDLKRHKLSHLKLDWSVNDGKAFVDAMQELSDQEETRDQKTPFKITGQVIIPGLTSGHGAKQILKHSTNPILICSHITRHHLAHLNQLSGIVTSQPPTQLITQILIKKKIPVVLIPQRYHPLFVDKNIVINNATLTVSHKFGFGPSYPDQQTQNDNKKYLAVGGNISTVELTRSQHSDGLYFDFFAILSQLNLHPMEAIQKKNKVISALDDYFSKYTKKHLHSVLFKSIYENSHQLSQLNNGHKHESLEINPDLGFRGSIRYLSNPQLLKFELELIDYLSQRYSIDVAWISGYNRHFSELKTIVQLIKDYNIKHKSSIKIWMEINTPAEVLTFDHYPSAEFTGIILNFESLHSLYFAVDTNSQSFSGLYPEDITVYQKIIRELKSKNTDLPIFAKLYKNNAQIIKELYNDINGYICLPQYVDTTRYQTKNTYYA